MILTDTVQNVFVVNAPPLRLMLGVPAAAVTAPPHVLDTPGVLATTSPVGNVSLNATPLSPTEFEFVILNETDVLPPTGIDETANVFKILGGATTVRLALDELPVPPSVEVTGPAVLRYDPAVSPVMFNETVQDAFALIDPPERLMLVPPAFAVTDPLQVLLTFGVEEIVRPVGSVSLNATP